MQTSPSQLYFKLIFLNYRIMISIVFAALLIVSTTATSCSPKFLLPSTLHESVKIYSFETSNAGTKSLFAYTYLQSLFTGSPQAFLSINEMIVTQMTEINYQLSAQVKTNNLNLNFASKNMNWTSLHVRFILYSGQDIFSKVDTISVNEMTVNKAFNFEISVKSSSSSPSYIFTHFIIGVVSASSNQYHFSIQPNSVSSSQYSIIVSSTVKASFTIQTIYFDSTQTSFSYFVREFSLTSSQQPQYKTLWTNFAPTIYNLFGFSTIAIIGNNLSITANLDEVNSIFTIDNMNGFTDLKLNYFAIGAISSTVCSPCNNFIAIYGCLDVCPNNSYAQILNGGGKTCRQCNSTLGMSLNTQSSSCVCSNGKTYFQGNCYNLGELPPNCAQDQISINNQCVSTSIKSSCSRQNQYFDQASSSCLCATNFQRIQGQCVPLCPRNSRRNNNGFCECSSGFLMSPLKQCISICPANSFFDTVSNNCICNANYQMVKGVCRICGQNQAYDQTSRTCVARFVAGVGTGSVVTIVCQPNEVVINGVCECNQNSIKVGGKCTPCPPSTYKVQRVNQCNLCSSYCTSCQSNTTCTECNTGFQVNAQQCRQICGDGRKFILPCDDGNTKNGDGCSSTCQIEPGFACNGGNATRPDRCSRLRANAKITISIASNPNYISTGIITDFVVQPPVQRSRAELHRLFSLSFSNNNARPPLLTFSQGDDLTSIRCFFSYNGNLPNDIFTVRYAVNDENYGSDSVTIMYNSLVNPVKAAIKYLGGAGSDILE